MTCLSRFIALPINAFQPASDTNWARRSVVAYSVPANLVEGTAREHPRDRIRFFNIAIASLRELGYGLHACMRLGYIDQVTLGEFDQKLSYIGAPLRGLIARERAKKAAINVGSTAIAVLAMSQMLL